MSQAAYIKGQRAPLLPGQPLRPTVSLVVRLTRTSPSPQPPFCKPCRPRLPPFPAYLIVPDSRRRRPRLPSSWLVVNLGSLETNLRFSTHARLSPLRLDTLHSVSLTDFHPARQPPTSIRRTYIHTRPSWLPRRSAATPRTARRRPSALWATAASARATTAATTAC